VHISHNRNQRVSKKNERRKNDAEPSVAVWIRFYDIPILFFHSYSMKTNFYLEDPFFDHVLLCFFNRPLTTTTTTMVTTPRSVIHARMHAKRNIRILVKTHENAPPIGTRYLHPPPQQPTWYANNNQSPLQWGWGTGRSDHPMSDCRKCAQAQWNVLRACACYVTRLVVYE